MGWSLYWFALAVMAGVLAGYFRGYVVGVRDTEKRWSRAVAKAEWADRYPTSVRLGIHGMRYDKAE
jgi:hypothetical protein